MGFFERMMFGVMGPPELGDVSAPVLPLAQRAKEMCSKCHRPVDDHEIVRDPGLTYSRCPPPLD